MLTRMARGQTSCVHARRRELRRRQRDFPPGRLQSSPTARNGAAPPLCSFGQGDYERRVNDLDWKTVIWAICIALLSVVIGGVGALVILSIQSMLDGTR